MKVRILGTAAGGGLPQWNCGCDECVLARSTARHRWQDCLAITGDGSVWFLLNASPDLRAQLLAYPELAPPPTTRSSPVGGVLLTSAELDHTLGLLMLREADALTVWCTPTVRAGLVFGAALDSYTRVDWRMVRPDEPFALPGGLTVTAFAPGDKRPRYTATKSSLWTVAYRITDQHSGRSLVYAPGLARWSAAFTAGIRGADVVLLDGTFATSREWAATGHLSIEDSLPCVRACAGPRFFYTHLNNTNPYARPNHPAVAGLAAAGAQIARDGDTISL